MGRLGDGRGILGCGEALKQVQLPRVRTDVGKEECRLRKEN